MTSTILSFGNEVVNSKTKVPKRPQPPAPRTATFVGRNRTERQGAGIGGGRRPKGFNDGINDLNFQSGLNNLAQ